MQITECDSKRNRKGSTIASWAVSEWYSCSDGTTSLLPLMFLQLGQANSACRWSPVFGQNWRIGHSHQSILAIPGQAPSWGTGNPWHAEWRHLGRCFQRFSTTTWNLPSLQNGPLPRKSWHPPPPLIPGNNAETSMQEMFPHSLLSNIGRKTWVT